MGKQSVKAAETPCDKWFLYLNAIGDRHIDQEEQYTEFY